MLQNDKVIHITMNTTNKQNDFSINYSSHPISYDYPVRDSLYIVIPLTVIYSLIFLTGMVGNVITCVVISRNKSMHTATNYYLFSLAVSDLLLLLSGKTKPNSSIAQLYLTMDIFLHFLFRNIINRL